MHSFLIKVSLVSVAYLSLFRMVGTKEERREEEKGKKKKKRCQSKINANGSYTSMFKGAEQIY